MSERRVQKLPNLPRSSKDRVLLVFGVLVYIALYKWLYVHWLYPVFGYYGFDFNSSSMGYLLLAWILSVIPSFWMPLKISRPSQLAYWVLYLVVFIPSMFVPIFVAISGPTEITQLMLVFFAGFCIVGMSYRFRLSEWKPRQITRPQFWNGFTALGVLLAAWVLLIFRHQLSVVSFVEIYDLRSAADELITGTGLNYALMWLSGAINPFLMAWGLYQKRKLVFLAGALGQLLVYASLGTKGSIVSVLFIPALYLVLRGDRRRFGVKLAWVVVAILLSLAVWTRLTGSQPGPVLSILLFVLFMRTFSMNGLLTAQYYDFFGRFPQTHYSHVTGVNWFLRYPYSNPLGIEVGSFYSGDPRLDASAHFWATDGLAAYGLIGLILISIFCAFVFWVLDSVAKRHDPRFAALVISYGAFNLANISIFTSLLSGGLGLLILFLYLMPPENLKADTVAGAFVPVSARPG
jgi:hypothetical protein